MPPGVQSIEAIRRSVDVVPWNQLAHAYHVAWDAPAKLGIFLDLRSSLEALELAVDWLWASVLHQGNLYSASPPVLWILVDLIAARPDHPAASSILTGVRTVTDGLLAHGDHEEPTDPVRQNAPGEPAFEVWTRPAWWKRFTRVGGNKEYFKTAVVTSRPLRALVRHAIPVINSFLDHPDTDTRSAAVAAGLGALRVEPDDALSLWRMFEFIGDSRYDPGVWISVAMEFGAVGRDLSDGLAHSDRRVRLAAAMSPSTASDARSVAELVLAVAEPDWLDAQFPHGAAHLDMRLRFHVLRALLERTDPESASTAVIDAICTLIRQRAEMYTVDVEWGPVIHWAFRDRWIDLPRTNEPAPLPVELRPAQTAILRTLCEKAELWDPRFGNASLAFMRVQLPYDRDILIRLTRSAESGG